MDFVPGLRELLPGLLLALQEQDANQPQPPSIFNMMLPLLVILGIFYFIAWKPQARERKARAAMLEKLKTGDRVLMTSGMFGTVTNLSKDEVTVRVDDKNNTRIRFGRFAVQSVLSDDGAAGDSKPGKDG
jgi:preprotein translocase subunit YajC